MKEDIDLAEDYLKYCTQFVLDNCAEDLKFFEKMFEKGLTKRLSDVVATPFERLTYTRAVEILTQPKVVRGQHVRSEQLDDLCAVAKGCQIRGEAVLGLRSGQ